MGYSASDPCMESLELKKPLCGEGKEREREEEKKMERMEGQKWNETSQIIFLLWPCPRATGNSRFKNAKSPRQGKNSRKFPFGKMLDFARSDTISTQTSNIYLNHLQ